MKRPALLVAVVAVLAIVAFLPALRGEWIYDDHALIERNLNVHSFAHWTDWFASDFWNVGPDQGAHILYWRPLVSATYAIDWQLGGGSPASFHVSNLLFHALVAALAFFTLRRWSDSTAGAVVGALVFALHPTKAESVAWISGRTDVLCMLGILVAIAGIARRTRGERGGIVLEVAGTLVAYLSKEQAIVLPAFVAIEAWVAAERPALTMVAVKRITRAVIPQALVAIAYVVVRSIVLPIGAQRSGIELDTSDRVLSVLETLGHDLVLTFAPHDLSLQHGLVLSRGGELVHSIGHVVAGAALVAIACALIIAMRKRQPVISVGVALYFITLLPTANIKPLFVETLMSERFLYVPLFGLALLVATGIAAVPQKRLVLILAAAVNATLLILSLGRSVDFVSERELWAREAELHPESTTALELLLADALARNDNALALQILGRRREVHRTYDWRKGEAVVFAYDVALVASRLTPDLDRQSLQRLDRFLDAFVSGTAGTASIDLPVLRMTIPTPRADERSPIVIAQMLGLRAEIASRLGDDVAALELVSAAHEACRGCVQVRAIEAVTYARAGDYTRALAFPGNQRPALAAAKHLHDQAASDRIARAKELGTLGLWGRAHAALRGAQLAGEQRTFAAEVAFRAGDFAAARAGLDDARLRELALEMGWPPP